MSDDQMPSPRRVGGHSVSALSTLLLRGYAMLADSCPDCGCPLMRAPGGGDTLCVNCAPEAAAGGARLPRASAASAAEDQAQLNGKGMDHSAGSSDEEEAPGPALVAPPPPLNERLAAQRQQNQQHGSAARTARAAAPAASTSAAAGSQQTAGRCEPSQLVAEMMLEGWAMLADHCPRCLTPLLRRRGNGRIYCAGCDMDVRCEGEEAGQGTPQAVQNPHASIRPECPSARRLVRPFPPSVAAGGLPAAAACSPQRAALAAAARQMEVVTAELAQRRWAAGEQHGGAVDRAAAAVVARLEKAAGQLAGAPPAEATELVALVCQCANALAALARCWCEPAG